MKQKAFFIIFEGVSFGEKIKKLIKIPDTSCKYQTFFSLEIKYSGKVETFKIKFKNWGPKDCYCCLCEGNIK